MFTFIAILATLISAHHINFAGKFEKEVASPDTYINLGQLQKSTVNKVEGAGRHKYASSFYYNEPLGVKTYEFFPKMYKSGMKYMTPVLIPQGSRVGSPSIKIDVEKISNTDQKAELKSVYRRNEIVTEVPMVTTYEPMYKTVYAHKYFPTKIGSPKLEFKIGSIKNEGQGF